MFVQQETKIGAVRIEFTGDLYHRFRNINTNHLIEAARHGATQSAYTTAKVERVSKSDKRPASLSSGQQFFHLLLAIPKESIAIPMAATLAGFTKYGPEWIASSKGLPCVGNS